MTNTINTLSSKEISKIFTKKVSEEYLRESSEFKIEIENINRDKKATYLFEIFEKFIVYIDALYALNIIENIENIKEFDDLTAFRINLYKHNVKTLFSFKTSLKLLVEKFEKNLDKSIDANISINDKNEISFDINFTTINLLNPKSIAELYDENTKFHDIKSNILALSNVEYNNQLKNSLKNKLKELLELIIKNNDLSVIKNNETFILKSEKPLELK